MFKLRNSRFVLVLVMLLVGANLLVGCSSQPAPAAQQPAAEKPAAEQPKEEPAGKITEEFINIGTSSSGGLFNTVGVAMSQIWTEKIPGVKFSAQVTGGSGENCIMLSNKEAEMAIISAATVYEAANGEGQFAGKKISNMRVVTNLYPAIVQVPVLKKSNINSFDDFVGKKINIGQAGSGSEATTLTILESFGISLDSFDAQRLSHANAADAVIDEKLDGYINIGGPGQSHQMKAMASGKVKLINMDPKEKRDKYLKEYPYYYEYTIPAGSYPNQDNDAVTVATGTLLVAREDLSEELVYQVVKQLFENKATLEQSQAIAKEITLESALNVAGMPLHPGAERYFKEVGVLK